MKTARIQLKNDFTPYPEYKDSGIEWIGKIPKEWGVTPLRSVAIENEERNYNGQCQNLLSLSYGRIIEKDINTSSGLLPESFNTYQIVRRGNIVFRLTDLQNDKKSLRVGYVDDKEFGIITSAYLALVTNKLLDNKYAYYLFHSYDLQKVYYGMGGGVRQTLDYSDFKYLPMLLPNIPTQKKIAEYLDEKTALIDEIIEKKKKLIELLHEKRTAVINHAVTRSLDPNVELVDSGIEWIGMTPRGWETFKIKHLFSFQAGDGFPDSLQGNDEGEIPFLKVSDINGEELYIRAAHNYVSSETVRERSWHLISPGSVLMAKIGAALTRNHRKINMVPVCIDNNMMAMIPKNILNNDFGYWLLRTIDMTDYQNISSVPSINMDHLKNTYRVLPPIEMQSDIVSYLESEVIRHADLMNKMEKSIEVLKEFKSSLISNVVTGKVKI